MSIPFRIVRRVFSTDIHVCKPKDCKYCIYNENHTCKRFPYYDNEGIKFISIEAARSDPYKCGRRALYYRELPRYIFSKIWVGFQVIGVIQLISIFII